MDYIHGVATETSKPKQGRAARRAQSESVTKRGGTDYVGVVQSRTKRERTRSAKECKGPPAPSPATCHTFCSCYSSYFTLLLRSVVICCLCSPRRTHHAYIISVQSTTLTYIYVNHHPLPRPCPSPSGLAMVYRWKRMYAASGMSASNRASVTSACWKTKPCAVVVYWGDGMVNRSVRRKAWMGSEDGDVWCTYTILIPHTPTTDLPTRQGSIPRRSGARGTAPSRRPPRPPPPASA